MNYISLKFVDGVIVTSKSYYNLLPHIRNKYIIPWGVEPRLRHKEGNGNGYRLLYVGQLQPYKGLKILLNAVKDYNAELSIIGDGPNKAEYEKYSRKLQLNNVSFHGVVSDKFLFNEYTKSDVLILPSISRNEAFGLVTLEAIASGCAVIASNIPGLRDIVSDFGLLVKPNDVQSLRRAIDTLKDNSVREHYLAKGQKVLSRYDWKQVAESYSKIYHQIINKK